MNCLTNESTIWRRSPSDIDRKRKVFKQVLCNDCGIYWLKYAKTKPISESVKRMNGQSHVNGAVGIPNSNGSASTDTSNTSQKRKRNESSSKAVVKKLKEEVNIFYLSLSLDFKLIFARNLKCCSSLNRLNARYASSLDLKKSYIHVMTVVCLFTAVRHKPCLYSFCSHPFL